MFIQAQIKRNNESKMSILFHSSIMGVWRGLLGLPFQHPFDNIKTNMQAYQSTFKITVQNIYKRQGFLGLYSGFLINSLRVASKQIYRWPLQIGLFGFYRKFFNQKISRGTLGIICGINMAIIEVAILCPFQRIKVWLMTASNHSTMRQFFRKLSMKALFDGMFPVFCKQLVSWVTFLGATQFFKDRAYRYSNKDRFENELSYGEVMFISSCVALVNTFFVMPIDCIKTNYQKNLNNEISDKGLSNGNRFKKAILKIYDNYGLMGFWKGWQIKLIQYSINSLFTVKIFESILKEYQKKVLNVKIQG